MVELDEKTLESNWVRWRHDFHRFPETGFNERGTSDRVAQVLQMLGLEVHRGIGGTGVVASLKVGSGTGDESVTNPGPACFLTDDSGIAVFVSPTFRGRVDLPHQRGPEA